MPGIIVIGRVLLQLAAQQHAAAYHNEISGQNDQYHRHKDGENIHQHGNGLRGRVLPPGQIGHGSLSLHGVKGIKQAYAKGEGQKIDPVVPK